MFHLADRAGVGCEKGVYDFQINSEGLLFLTACLNDPISCFFFACKCAR